MSKRFDKNEHDTWVSWVQCSQQVMAQVEQALKDGGYPPLVWYDALLELDFSPGNKLRLQDLGDKMLLKKFNVTRLVDRLEKEGLVERIACDSDARGAYAAITTKGEKLRRAMWPCYRNAVRKYFLSRMDATEMDVLMKLMKKIRQN